MRAWKFSSSVAILLFATLPLAQCLAVGTSTSSTNVSRLEDARIDDIDKNLAYLTITDCPAKCDGGVSKLIVREALQGRLKAFHKGDHVTIDLDDQKALQSIAARTLPVGAAVRWLVLGLAFTLSFLVAALLTWWHPLRLIIGQDGRYSNSKFQMAIWFTVVIAVYLATLYLRVSQAGWEFLGGVNIPQNLFLLSGMSALTFGGAKAITTAKVEAAKAAGNPAPKSGGQPDFWRNLTQNDAGAVDFGDFQMIVVTMLAVGTYLVLTFNFLGSIEFLKSVTLPDVDTTILAAFGLGQGAYLTKKAMGNLGTS